ncbi:hypothetical protein [Pseudomonas tolaasii]|uniref:hypothetical protein n=1 Tax=Pseudomonas tolaasii TaxID=29442 RepID=UPI0027324E32|nr:hypothetical protein [Pseudomonas tolaasii]WLH51299.1 hypothetical protein PSH62_24995 [Pseudomonas tolaasii]
MRFLDASPDLPPLVRAAHDIDWEVIVDGYLTDAAAVRDVYAATLYLDHSRVIENGSTVVTPSVRAIAHKQGFTLVRSRCGNDHYVIVSKLREALSA